VVLACGSLTPRKDYATLIRSFSLLQQERYSRLLILGRGAERDRLVDLATELRISDRIDFPGFVTNPIPWMRHASVFAHTSRWEGLGIVLVEALACGTPVVAMDCPHGPSEILEGGRYGRLVPPGDYRGFAQALERALANPIEPEEARRRASDFRSDRAAAAYLKAMALD
jgi:glycosyltransferase involved in cell wall biosynthesis